MVNNKPEFNISQVKSIASIVMLVIATMGCITGIVTGIVYVVFLGRVEKGEKLSDFEIFISQDLFYLVGITELVITLLCAIPFCLWFYQAYKNLLFFEICGLQFSPAWAVGSFFVPFLNIVRPYKIAREIFNASDPSVNFSENKNWVEIKEPTVVIYWWNSFLVAGILNQLNGLLFKGNTISNLRYSTMCYILADISLIVSAIFAILMIIEVNKMQQQKYNKLFL